MAGKYPVMAGLVPAIHVFLDACTLMSFQSIYEVQRPFVPAEAGTQQFG